MTKYINTLNYSELIDLHNILEQDDDTIFKWYSNQNQNDKIPINKVSKLLKEFKIK